MYIKHLIFTLIAVLFCIQATKAANITQDWHLFSGIREVNIIQGDTITWDWSDPALGETHTVSSTDADWNLNGVFDSGPLTDGTVSRTFEETGTFHYICMIHPEMRMRVIVDPAENITEPEESLEPSVEVSLEPSLEASLEPSLELSLEPSLEASLEPSLELSLEPSLEASYLPTEPSASASASPSCAASTIPESPMPSASPMPSVSSMPSVSPSTSYLPTLPSESPSPKPRESECPEVKQCSKGCKKTIINIDLSNIFKDLCKPPPEEEKPSASASRIPEPSESASMIPAPSESSSASFIPEPEPSPSASVSPTPSVIPQ